VAGAIAGGAMASLGFYHVTQTAAVRISPGDSDRAIAVLTIWGAFASAIYIPMTAWLVTRFDWRFTLRVIAVTVFVAFAAGAILIDTRHRKSSPPPIFGALGEALKQPRGRRLIVSQVLAGLGVGTILVYQVPAMTAAGLTLAAASFWAGFRGFAQLGGRLPLMPMVRRLGVVNSLILAYLAIAVGALALGLADNHLLAAVYAIVAGFGIGAVSPLIGMYSRVVFGEAALGTAMGLVGLGFLLANALGPIAAAVIAENTGSRAIPVLISAGIVALAAVVVRTAESSP
jgi:predicted MFS family arabinose efflux permease